MTGGAVRRFVSHILTGSVNDVAIALGDQGPKPVAAQRVIDKYPAPAGIGRYTQAMAHPRGLHRHQRAQVAAVDRPPRPSQRNPLADKVIRVQARCTRPSPWASDAHTPVLKIVTAAGVPMTPDRRRCSFIQG
jgi:hypothetical protein